MKEPGKIIANYLMNDISGELKKRKLTIKECPLSPEELGEIAYKVSRGIITQREGKNIILEKFVNLDLEW